MILTDYYKAEKLTDAQSRFDVTASTGGYSGDADPPCPVMLTPLKDYGSENLND